jgi:hypothetical protein
MHITKLKHFREADIASAAQNIPLRPLKESEYS